MEKTNAKKKAKRNENLKLVSTWMQILASLCAIVAFYWEVQRHQKSEETTKA